ncbi:MAG TPA: ABC transporter substrate-binding protein [Casimicrobiaceae bacterium]|nr:ABC transporter substrate-binding protein [Casimicrobiaceae bacterium]
MHRRRALVGVASATLLVAAPGVHAQSPGPLRRIGFLSGGYVATRAPREAFVDELAKHGWVAGRNLAIEIRYAEGRYDRLPALADELVRANVELIAAGPAPAAVVAKRATSTIPIVMLTVGDPVGLGLVASLARPGGNVTGTSFDVSFDVFRKQLELLREAVPGVRRVAVLVNPANPGLKLALDAIRTSASSLGLSAVPVEARGPDDFDAAFAQIAGARFGAVLMVTEAVFNAHVAQLVSLAERHRLPTIYGVRSYVEAGGLLAYGASLENGFRRSAVFVDRILRGAKPADLPVEQPSQYELAVNLKTARALGLTLPPTLLSRADVVVR